MTSTTTSKLIPAQLAFLAIYNPTLGPDDDSFPDQLVYWYSRKYNEQRAAAAAARKAGMVERVGAEGDGEREDRNESLRQIGLAQGVVGFARSFSNGEPVDAIETERSRIVLVEVETGWWVLASIDLTRLPAIFHNPSETLKKSSNNDKAEAPPRPEYSSREVSPPALLTQQIIQAHHVFVLHHGPSLSELFVRLPRDRFCGTLDRFWSRFCKTWDVLLHGNPAADIFSGLKLAAGGELGFGVGEEEWGSGEREVLEDLTRRTEGLIDLVVSRFGEPAQVEASDDSHLPESESLPWMGSGSQPAASDGVVFGGVGAVGRSSLRSVSLWMRQIYTYGEYGYGVRDNPSRERRKRRRRNPPPQDDVPRSTVGSANGAAIAPMEGANGDFDPNNLSKRVQMKAAAEQGDGKFEEQADPVTLPKDPRPQIHPRVASHDHAAPSAEHTPDIPLTRPGIPPPIVSAAELALDKATKGAAAGDAAGRQEGKKGDDAGGGGGSSWGVPENYIKYLTFGLSELGKGRSGSEDSSGKPQRPAVVKRASTASSGRTIRPARDSQQAKRVAAARAEDEDVAAAMIHVDPMPERENLKAKIAMQRRQENRGHFVVGLKGDLDVVPNADGDDEDADVTDGSFGVDAGGSRTVLRTLQVEVLPKRRDSVEENVDAATEEDTMDQILSRRAEEAEPENIAAKNMKRVRVIVYVHRPFIYCFLFEDRTPSLSIPGFYRELHRNLLPIHKPLLSSTNVAKVAQRIEMSHLEAQDETQSLAESVRTGGSNRLPAKGGVSAGGTRPIFDLIWDPRLLTVHASIPNIPEPGTPAAEGLAAGGPGQLGFPPGWSRVEALNVHSCVLNTLASVKAAKTAATGEGTGRDEVERTCKTSRGWWVVWMRVPPSDAPVSAPADVEPKGKNSRKESSMATLHNLAVHNQNYGDEPTDSQPHKNPDNKREGDGDGDLTPARSTSTLQSMSQEGTTSTSNPAISTQLRDINLSDDEDDPVKMPGTPPKSRPATTRAGSTIAPKPDMSRIAFLVRRSSDATSASSSQFSASGRAAGGSGGGGMSGMWSAMGLKNGLGFLSGVREEEKTGGQAAGWGPPGGSGTGALGGGMGVDARRYVEGLLSLNR